MNIILQVKFNWVANLRKKVHEPHFQNKQLCVGLSRYVCNCLKRIEIMATPVAALYRSCHEFQ